MAQQKLKKSKSVFDMIPKEMRMEVLPVSLLAELPPEEKMARLFKARALSIELHLPNDEVITALRDVTLHLPDAQAFVIESDDEYDLAKERAFALKDEADGFEVTRKEGTQPLLGMKYAWDSLFATRVSDRQQSALVYINKMRAYENQKRQEAEDAKAKAELLLKDEQETARNDAQDLLLRAENTKNARMKQTLRDEAASILRSAELMPTEVATSQIAEPQMSSGSKALPWNGEVDEPNVKDALRWLLEDGHEEWINALIEWRPSGLNTLAKQVKNSKKISGFKFFQKSSYRRPPKAKL